MLTRTVPNKSFRLPSLCQAFELDSSHCGVRCVSKAVGHKSWSSWVYCRPWLGHGPTIANIFSRKHSVIESTHFQGQTTPQVSSTWAHGHVDELMITSKLWSRPAQGELSVEKKTFNSRSKGLERASILFFHSPYSLNAPKRALKLAIWHQLAGNILSFRQRARTLLRGLCRIWTKDYPEFIYNTYACMSWKITIPINQRQLSHTDVFSWSG